MRGAGIRVWEVCAGRVLEVISFLSGSRLSPANRYRYCHLTLLSETRHITPRFPDHLASDVSNAIRSLAAATWAVGFPPPKPGRGPESKAIVLPLGLIRRWLVRIVGNSIFRAVRPSTGTSQIH